MTKPKPPLRVGHSNTLEIFNKSRACKHDDLILIWTVGDTQLRNYCSACGERVDT